MRFSWWLAASLPLVLVAAACSSSEDEIGTDDSNLTDRQLGTKALQILGAQKIPGAQQQCNKCHDINRKSLKVWDEQYKGAIANINDPIHGCIELAEQPPNGKLRKASESWK